jgi:hypothetical protein
MIDFMYGRGDVMLYPNAPADPRTRFASLSFSTTYMERGAHSGTDGHFELAATDALRPSSEHDKRKTVPLVPLAEAPSAADALAAPPPYAQLPVIGLLHDRVEALASLAGTGREFLERAAQQTSATRQQFDALRAAWLTPYTNES